MSTPTFIQLPTDGAGKKIRLYDLGDGTLAEAAVLLDGLGHELDVRLVNGVWMLSVAIASLDAPASPHLSALSSASLASGASVALETADITSPKTGKLLGMRISSSTQVKAVVSTVAGGVPTTKDTIFTSGSNPSYLWQPPHKDFVTQAGGSGNKFRATITNQDTIAADVYCTVYWDEV